MATTRETILILNSTKVKDKIVFSRGRRITSHLLLMTELSKGVSYPVSRQDTASQVGDQCPGKLDPCPTSLPRRWEWSSLMIAFQKIAPRSLRRTLPGYNIYRRL